MKKLLIVCTFFLYPALVHATFTNGSFETGSFSGWSIIGDTLVVDASFGTAPASGIYQALVTNAPSPPGFGDQHPQPYSGNPSVDAFALPPPLVTPLDTFLGLPSTSVLNFFHSLLPSGSTPFPTWEGSGIRQSFTANAGDVLTFRWNYLTNECMCPLADFAFIVLNGALTFLADATSTSAGSGTDFRFESGYRLFATTLTTSGPQYVAVAVVDTVNDPAVNSAVLVDDFSIQKVPEPASLFLIPLGLIVMVGLGRRARCPLP
jgi:hypothetical protein